MASEQDTMRIRAEITDGYKSGSDAAEPAKPIAPERITRYFASGIVRSDSGSILTDIPYELDCADAAVAQAKQIANTPGFIGAWAYSRTGWPEIGWYGDQEPLARFGPA
jgi:hypothetical protein